MWKKKTSHACSNALFFFFFGVKVNNLPHPLGHSNVLLNYSVIIILLLNNNTIIHVVRLLMSAPKGLL